MCPKVTGSKISLLRTTIGPNPLWPLASPLVRSGSDLDPIDFVQPERAGWRPWGVFGKAGAMKPAGKGRPERNNMGGQICFSRPCGQCGDRGMA